MMIYRILLENTNTAVVTRVAHRYDRDKTQTHAITEKGDIWDNTKGDTKKR